MAEVKSKDYMINEGNKIGYMPTEFGADGKLIETKIVAGAAIKKGQVVEITADMTVSPTTAASDKVLGVAMFDVEKGDPVTVETEGLFKLTAGASITAGSHIESAADGAVATSSGSNAIGIALNDASKDDNVFVKFSI